MKFIALVLVLLAQNAAAITGHDQAHIKRTLPGYTYQCQAQAVAGMVGLPVISNFSIQFYLVSGRRTGHRLMTRLLGDVNAGLYVGLDRDPVNQKIKIDAGALSISFRRDMNPRHIRSKFQITSDFASASGKLRYIVGRYTDGSRAEVIQNFNCSKI